MTKTKDQSTLRSVGNVHPQQQKKKEHVVHWFRKGQDNFNSFYG